jgi:hypothetical protein
MSGVATAIIGSAVIGGVVQSKAAKKAVGAQTAASEAALAQQESAFSRLQSSLKPYTEGGGEAFSGLLDMMGVRGPERASQAVIDVEASPQFESMTRQGEEAILANAAATGGLRGGNVQQSLAQFRPQVLNQLLQQKFARLMETSRLGQASAAGVGAGAIQTGGTAGNILLNQGEAIGQGNIAQGNIQAGLIGGAGSELSRYLASRQQTPQPAPIPEQSVTF